MFNLGWGVFFVLVNFGLFLICCKMFGRQGMYAWIGIATVIANIQVTKTIEMFSMVMTLGNTMYGTIYLATDLLNEKYGEKAAKKAVWFGFFTLITSTIIMQMALVFQEQPGDVAQEHLQAIFGLLPQLAVASLAAYFTSQFLDVRLFSMLKKMFPKPGQLWIRNNGSTMVSQLLDSLVFCLIAFSTEYPFEIWWQIFITTFLIKFVISAASTPIIYIARSFKDKEEVVEKQRS